MLFCDTRSHVWCLNLRSVSLRFSAYLCVLCVYGCFNAEVAEVRREPQRKTESKTLLLLNVYGFGVFGSRIANVEPWPGSLVMLTEPPSSLTDVSTASRPTPRPEIAVTSDA